MYFYDLLFKALRKVRPGFMVVDIIWDVSHFSIRSQLSPNLHEGTKDLVLEALENILKLLWLWK